MKKFSKISSAEVMALVRTLGYKENGATIRSDDYMAEVFLSKFMRLMLSFSFIRTVILAIYAIKLPGGLPYIMAKSRVIDDMLLHALDEDQKPEQLLILGAGYDTRCYRFHEQLKKTQCFEIDHPEMIARKRSAIQQAVTASMKNDSNVSSVHYCAADFNGKDNFDLDWLSSQGIDHNKKTVFIVDGLSYFLQPEAFEHLMSVIALFPKNSQVIFDYIYADILHKSKRRGSEAFKSSLKKIGEPVSHGLVQNDLESYLDKFGFEVTDLITPKKLEKEYLTNAKGKSVQPYDFLDIAFIRKCAPHFNEG